LKKTIVFDSTELIKCPNHGSLLICYFEDSPENILFAICRGCQPSKVFARAKDITDKEISQAVKAFQKGCERFLKD
jgi:hypothetical protein